MRIDCLIAFIGDDKDIEMKRNKTNDRNRTKNTVDVANKTVK